MTVWVLAKTGWQERTTSRMGLGGDNLSILLKFGAWNNR
jgi:hypothetical protein